jgi:hypothetical protein
MQEEIGEDLFVRLVDDCKNQFGMNKRKDAIKNPALLTRVLQQAKQRQKTSPTLERIVSAVVKLRNREDGAGAVKAAVGTTK